MAGNAAQTESATLVITVGGAGSDDELPNTGANTQALLVTALVLFAAAGAFVAGNRKLQHGGASAVRLVERWRAEPQPFSPGSVCSADV